MSNHKALTQAKQSAMAPARNRPPVGVERRGDVLAEVFAVREAGDENYRIRFSEIAELQLVGGESDPVSTDN
ncbi:MAG: hypothetical protein BJ554DRAFT_7221 [Olpidium bornovanus]|uniref:Uncharacterized protein n=1 Tax=Olpidium bornovanus TaxID=278681 RepID=A0A8H7ZX87_9FUNG|nr:MAG: hypothetical protein BJ554DRAFT_7221 [Olpidium bornovanus]